MSTSIQLVPIHSRIYNAADKPGHERGKAHTPGKRVALAYSVHHIDAEGRAHCQSRNVLTGELYAETIPAANLEPIPHRKG